MFINIPVNLSYLLLISLLCRVTFTCTTNCMVSIRTSIGIFYREATVSWWGRIFG